MKRWPILLSFILFVGLCVSGTFWAMQLFKPAVRPVAAPKQQAMTEVNPEVAVDLFGGRPVAAAATSNFQLKGVVVARNAAESVAILVPDGKPAVAVRVDSEAVPGVRVTEVHAKYVLLSEGGAIKRVELPASAQQSHPDSPLGAPQMPPPMPPPMQPNTNGQGLVPQNIQPETEPPANSPPGRIGRPLGHN